MPCADHQLSLIVLQLNKPAAPAKGKKVKGSVAPPKINLATMHNDVREALASLQVKATHDSQKLWLPQFKIGNKKE